VNIIPIVKTALEPLWKLLNANDIKEEPQVQNNHQQNGHEEIFIEAAEALQPEAIKQSVVSNKKG